MDNKVGYQPIKPMNKHVKAACRGAALTASCLSVSTALSWATDSVCMNGVVKKLGGKSKYAKIFGRNLVLASLAGAAASALMSIISNNVQPKKPPRAVN